ncbi:MAG: cytochrome P450 [Acidimicrobiaceae bacterium]|nr:cytochrome P450 [Acidimicrobiaceae bacterium]
MSTTVPYLNLLDPDFYVDPWSAYRWLRNESPVHWDPVQKLWGISRYADVLEVETQTDLYTSLNGSRPHLDQSADRSMINLDDPLHQEQRKLVVRRFTPRAVRNKEDRVRELADAILDEATAAGSRAIEVVEQVASRLPAMVIAELLGYAPEQWTTVRKVSEMTMYNAGQTPVDGSAPNTGASSVEAMTEWAAATMEVIAARRAHPRDDLISVWCHSAVDGVAWDDRRILEEAILVLDGGAETTRTVIGAIVRELALRPTTQRQLRDNPQLLTQAVEEFVRWVSPILNMRRTVTQDHEFRGQRLRQGEEILLLYPAANRDERVYDAPEEFDVTRARNHHVAFGFGTHVCLGAPLARMELKVMFEQLLSRLPEWRLVPGTEPQIIPSTFARAYDAVHIEF